MSWRSAAQSPVQLPVQLSVWQLLACTTAAGRAAGAVSDADGITAAARGCPAIEPGLAVQYPYLYFLFQRPHVAALPQHRQLPLQRLRALPQLTDLMLVFLLVHLVLLQGGTVWFQGGTVC